MESRTLSDVNIDGDWLEVHEELLLALGNQGWVQFILNFPQIKFKKDDYSKMAPKDRAVSIVLDLQDSVTPVDLFLRKLAAQSHLKKVAYELAGEWNVEPSLLSPPAVHHSPGEVHTSAPVQAKRKSAADVLKQDPKAQDGEYMLWNDAANRELEFYCHGMQTGNPTEYLTLKSQGKDRNFSMYATAGKEQVNVYTYYQKIRIDPQLLLVKTDDNTFSNTVGTAHNQKGERMVEWNSYAVAADCRTNNSDMGLANIDLMGTPFHVAKDQFEKIGWNPGGSASYGARDKIVNIKGGGYCGCMGPKGMKDHVGKGGEFIGDWILQLEVD